MTGVEQNSTGRPRRDDFSQFVDDLEIDQLDILLSKVVLHKIARDTPRVCFHIQTKSTVVEGTMTKSLPST